ncbi:MAG: YggT family protein [Gammaproteobacteria bacterium]|nr:YggT family protein [Gammaproteobacteria bacterium]
MPYFSQAALFLIQVVFGFYTLLVLLRFLFQLARASFYNPISQFIVALTNPLLKPLRRLIPGMLGIDWAAVVLLVALMVLEIYLTSWLYGFTPAITAVIVLTVARLIRLTVYVYLVAIFARAVMSWINPYGERHPLGDLLAGLTEPLLFPARRMIPSPQGIDLSPLVVSVLLILTLMLIVQPIMDLSFTLDPRLASVIH